MKWRRRGKRKSSVAGEDDPIALVDAGAKEPDDLNEVEMAQIDRELNEDLNAVAVQGIARAVEPPADLRTKIGTGIEKKLLARQTTMMCFDLLTTGWHTTRVVMSPEDDE